ncbi:MAG: hypothetical protein NTU57_05060 [Candidatus Aenigmarchaeota archaeon]|nr:hypothetical protein [Candidatus Aenigmarchaeota archaeon]
MFNKKTKELIFYEIKAGIHKLHKTQHEMMLILKEGKKTKAFLCEYESKSGEKIKPDQPITLDTPSKDWEGVKAPYFKLKAERIKKKCNNA